MPLAFKDVPKRGWFEAKKHFRAVTYAACNKLVRLTENILPCLCEQDTIAQIGALPNSQILVYNV